MAKSRYTVTTPIYYVNDSPHIGHAYTSLACDVLARFMRLDGREVFFLTGTDEHGQKVEKSAAALGVAPQVFADDVSGRFRALSDILNLSNDDFIRTTEARHVKACQALWQRMVEADQIYLGAYAGWYAVRDEAFYGEDELTTDAQGRKLAPSGAVCEWVEEPSYFFRLSAWAKPLIAHYEAHPDAILPESRRNEVMSFLRGGLRDLSISRTTYRWGVSVPGDDDHIMYVWLDALTNYLSALGWPDDSARVEAFWPADLHMVGKDILRFHAVYWPAFLMAAGLPVPRRVFAHGWWTIEGEKMSKSLGNVIAPADLAKRYGVDAVRYFLLREVPFGNDGDFSHAALVGRINGDLANDIGNLAQRSLSMIHQNCAAQVPDPGAFSEADQAMLASAEALLGTVREHLERQAFHKALEAIWAVVGAANRYVDEQAPWALKKTDPARMATVLYVLAETVRRLALLIQPFMPESAARMLDQLAIDPQDRGFDRFGAQAALEPGTALPKPQGVFPRHVEEEVA